MAANNSEVWHRRLSVTHSWGLASAHKRVQYNKFGFIFSGNMEYQLEDAKDLLRRTPETLKLLLTNLPKAWLMSNEGPNTWSPYDIVGHLVHGEETDWIPRAR